MMVSATAAVDCSGPIGDGNWSALVRNSTEHVGGTG